MASYTSPSISGYNDNPPSNDGSVDNTNNLVDWDRHIDEIGDPIKAYAEAIDSATTTAFALVDGSINALEVNTSDVGFEAENTAGSTVTHDATNWQATPWPTENRDADSNFTHGPTISDGYYTAPSDGIYQFNVNLGVNSSADNSWFEVALFVDPLGGGSYVIKKRGQQMRNDTGGSWSMYAGFSGTLDLDATDRVKVYYRYSDGSATNRSMTTGAGFVWFDGFRVNNTN